MRLKKEQGPSGSKLLKVKVGLLLTAGGKIQCLRCTANSSRTGVQCGRPALKSSKTQKCQYHGGRSTGPKTAEGKARIAAAHNVRGQETKTASAELSAGSAELSRLEGAAYFDWIMTGPRTRGRTRGATCRLKRLVTWGIKNKAQFPLCRILVASIQKLY
jgi:hypothetical protein